MIELRTLGTTQVRSVGSTDAAIYLQPKRFALLAYLAAARPRGLQRRDTLLVMFWPEESESRARNALSQTLHAIRRDLGADALISEGHQLVGIDAARLSCDAVEFEEALERGELEEALRLYRGEFLGGLLVGGATGFERWQEAEAWRLQRRAWEAATGLAERAEAEGNVVGSIHWLERALEMLPTDEVLLRRLVLLLDSLGDRAGALRAYERHTQLMREEYAIDPSPETSAVWEEIRHRSAPISRPAVAPSKRRPIRSIAVLPLENLTGGREDEYFADGMTEMLTTELSGIDALRVVSRQSVRGLKGSDRPLRDLSELLGVDAVLEGSVLRAGDRIRVVLQLVRVEPEEHLWAGAYDRDLQDVLRMYSEVAHTVAGEVQAKLTGEEQKHLSEAERRTVNPRAYDRLLRGIALFGQSAYQQALDQFEAAVRLDPEFAEAHAWMAEAIGRIALVAGPQLADPMQRHVQMALRLDPTLQWAHAVQAYWLQLFTRDWGAAEQAYRRATGARRKDPRALQDYVQFLAGQCRFDEAVVAVNELLRFDPGVAVAHFGYGWVEHKARRYEAAVERLEFTIARWPEFLWTPVYLAATYVLLGRVEEATALIRRSVDAAPSFPILLGYAAAIFGRAEAAEDARRMQQRLQALQRDSGYVDPFNLALAHMGLDQHDAALSELERCAQEGSTQNWAMAPEPFFDPLRHEPRFREVLRRLDLPEWTPPTS